MKSGQRIALWALGLVAAATLATEDHLRRADHRNYQQALEGRRLLEQRVAHVLGAHDLLRQNLQREQQRSQELAEALAKTQTQLEQVVGRLNEETQSVQTLKTRLSKVHEQMDQLQVELALELQTRQSAGAENPDTTGPIQLERIVVSSAESPGLQGHILSVHPDWDFVVIDVGWNAVKVGDVVSITRDGRLLAKARVERVQEAVCAATILPDWQTADIHIYDVVRIL